MRKKRSIKSIFQVLLIAFAVVAFWRGVWGLLDVFLFPNNYVLSLIISALVGIIILYLTKHLLKDLI